MPVNPQLCLMCSHCVFASESEPVQWGISECSDHQILTVIFLSNATSKTILIMNILPARRHLLTAVLVHHFTSSSYMLKASSSLFLALAHFSHFVLTSSLCCSVIKQCVLEGNGLRDKGGTHKPQGKMVWEADTVTSYACIYDSSINKWRPPSSH